ncbi:ead/Ea22-like family protein [Cronobacter sakazakii]|uniref:ead/Ea22-like family protein n=2 Tax=Cronobacter sakazakii TaxID=28141 RepID=UPI0020777400|nr:ead/Ea22-like family protein [Cronobacter sakazakii]ELY2731103.1 ead/Ea22-like family protein [Cronobacter sakazakii]USI30443.1 ead/Ea22-like family protein [Cronobacter sakazakii]
MHSENNELVKAGHELAKCLDSNTPLIDIAKMIVRLADKLDVTTLALREKTKQCEQLAAENAVLKDAREIKPTKGEVLVTVSGYTGCGKSAIAGEIEIALRAIGVPVEWAGGDAEKRMTGADWLTAIEMYKPSVKIIEVNVPRAAAGINLETGGEA